MYDRGPLTHIREVFRNELTPVVGLNRLLPAERADRRLELRCYRSGGRWAQPDRFDAF